MIRRPGAGRALLVALALLAALAPPLARPAAAQGLGAIVAWGNNGDGQSTVPADLTNVTAIAASYSHTVALQADLRALGLALAATPPLPPIAWLAGRPILFRSQLTPAARSTSPSARRRSLPAPAARRC